MFSITVTLHDTGAIQTFSAAHPIELIQRYGDHILGANLLEGRPETLYFEDPLKKEAHRIEHIEAMKK